MKKSGFKIKVSLCYVLYYAHGIHRVKLTVRVVVHNLGLFPECDLSGALKRWPVKSFL